MFCPALLVVFLLPKVLWTVTKYSFTLAPPYTWAQMLSVIPSPGANMPSTPVDTSGTKKPYEQPQLKEHGDLRTLTQAGSKGDPEPTGPGTKPNSKRA